MPKQHSGPESLAVSVFSGAEWSLGYHQYHCGDPEYRNCGISDVVFGEDIGELWRIYSKD